MILCNGLEMLKTCFKLLTQNVCLILESAIYIGCLRSKAEAPIDTCEALAEIGRILTQPGFEKAKIIIEGMREK